MLEYYDNKIHRVRKKWNHSIFASNIAKCWPIFKNLSPTDLAVNFYDAIVKYPTIPQTRALPWEILTSERQK